MKNRLEAHAYMNKVVRKSVERHNNNNKKEAKWEIEQKSIE